MNLASCQGASCAVDSLVHGYQCIPDMLNIRIIQHKITFSSLLDNVQSSETEPTALHFTSQYLLLSFWGNKYLSSEPEKLDTNCPVGFEVRCNSTWLVWKNLSFKVKAWHLVSMVVAQKIAAHGWNHALRKRTRILSWIHQHCYFFTLK